MGEPDPLEQARERLAGFLAEEGYYQDVLPGMEDCEFGCMPIDHGEFEYGDPDD